MPGCCAYQCSSRSEKGVRLFYIPRGDRNRNAVRRKQWIHNIGRKDFAPSKHVVLCELLGCLLHAAIKQASKDLEASHNGALQQQQQREKDHKKLRFQCSDQSEGLVQYWNNMGPVF
ncbi:uncharacterized protein LOC142772139 isoform X2 [Rhipicephalus microplus]|uniref:uncharacterized protein LOC142772139 isoform X2 n=1 Tax=Rhipicephalus microplus TaxID=6941 RepID=UPI003F6C7B79